MRIISMVPSWTETLMIAGAQVVGRTRFCIHPAPLVKAIPVVGGTKDIDWDKVRSLKPDLLLLDREENPKAMNDEAPCPVLATHVRGVEDVAGELERMAHALKTSETEANGGELAEVSAKLLGASSRWRKVCAAQAPQPNIDAIPGIVEWIRKPSAGEDGKRNIKVVYVIWKNPWMSVSKGTFVASMIERVGLEILPVGEGLYPAFEIDSLPKDAILFFSTEPFPFHRKRKELEELPFASAIVNGESFSWFGSRALEFLEKSLRMQP